MMMLITSLNLYARDSAAPDMALLEFLGEGVKVDNDIIDPMTWQAMQDMTGSHQDARQQGNKPQAKSQQDSRRHDHE